MSCLGTAFDIQGYIFKPFYLCLGVLYFMVLLSLLGVLYIVLLCKSTLDKVVKDIKKERNKYKRVN